ncbi:glycoside hydrolase family 15 [Citricoccus zhacaiensis]|uniref:Glycoside hydrolase family 15 n=1 Tax=Citricoccus zhacaiensis TaxID=489142 RepID=A0ABQ2M7K5_9MICC|nr:glycoside hydrolase family 15 protein [Citricoccus zhacaiensis]GGO47760.1 glycoside hydrolase family 15 [Citricoccus zhacaiensis]
MTDQTPSARPHPTHDSTERPGSTPSPSLHPAGATPLEDYALLSDLSTGPLVSRRGSVDWLCLPRFDSPALFAALLGGPDDGRWKLWAVDGDAVERRYVPYTFVLETTWRTPTGTVRVTDFLPPAEAQDDLYRRVECLSGEVVVEHDLRIRFDYARALPWFRRTDGTEGTEPALLCTAGPDGVLVTGPLLYSTTRPTADDEQSAEAAGGGQGGAGVGNPVSGASEHGREIGGEDRPAGSPDSGGLQAPRLAGRFRLRAGERLDWVLTWFPSWEEPPVPMEPEAAQHRTQEFWTDWASRLEVDSPEEHLVARSLLVLRALTNLKTGGIVAAPTTSLPEEFGGSRNWDYRYTWLRDAALTIEVLVSHGFTEGALHWRDWLLRAVAGDPEKLRIMYGLAGERELDEKELDHLAGYADSRPVRIGNGAADQYQADVVGEVMLALAELRDAGITEDEYSWRLQKSLLSFCVRNLDRKDHGIWEMRGAPHFFTHGRVMMWAAFNEGIRAVTEHGLDGDVASWTRHRDALRAEILERGFSTELDSFTQTYGGSEVDASLLQLPHTGFLAADDPMMLGTVAAIERDLMGTRGLVHRYRTGSDLDGLEGHEYAFLICSFWLVEQYAASGRLDDAEETMALLCSCATDLGLLAEEYDAGSGRLAGNFPQAFSHLALIRAADAIQEARRHPG